MEYLMYLSLSLSAVVAVCLCVLITRQVLRELSPLYSPVLLRLSMCLFTPMLWWLLFSVPFERIMGNEGLQPMLVSMLAKATFAVLVPATVVKLTARLMAVRTS
ncbi:hypothetical protein [Aliagarivorans marinus]|uniref:hypothetical protein n=1 Tax=Aliagarivorans marinus TaxID=561965 RepID=UPI0012F7A986|nr:hypothetical protein [Aliagarivorans marinus]